jgi:hypothetical protein
MFLLCGFWIWTVLVKLIDIENDMDCESESRILAGKIWS